MLGIVGQTKGAAVYLHSAHVTRRDGTWVTVHLFSTESVCELWHEKEDKKHPPARLERNKMHIERLHESKLEYARP